MSIDTIYAPTTITNTLSMTSSGIGLDAYQGFLLNTGMVHLTNNETINDYKVLTKQLSVTSSTHSERSIIFYNAANQQMGSMWLTDTTNGLITQPRFYLREQSGQATATTAATGYYETYRFPLTPTNMTKTITRNIFTTNAKGNDNLITMHSYTKDGLTFIAYKMGIFCQLICRGTTNTSWSGSHTFGSLPVAYSPWRTITVLSCNNVANKSDRVMIEANGRITIRNSISSTMAEYFNQMYFTRE